MARAGPVASGSVPVPPPTPPRSLADLLQLEIPAVAVAFLRSPPDGVEHVGQVEPAGCGYWRLARDRVFWTQAEDHAGCPIGVMTMGLEPSAEVATEAERLVQFMEEVSYLAPAEAASLPSVSPSPAVVVYGPEGALPVEPDVVLVTSTPAQAMLLAEASGAVHMGEPALRVHGRPACSAIPWALRSDSLELSLGCAGMRTFTAVEPEMLLSVVPGDKLLALTDRLEAVLAANREVQARYDSVL